MVPCETKRLASVIWQRWRSSPSAFTSHPFTLWSCSGSGIFHPPLPLKPGISLIPVLSAAPQTAHVLISDESGLKLADRLIPAEHGAAYKTHTEHLQNSGITPPLRLFTITAKPGISSDPVLCCRWKHAQCQKVNRCVFLQVSSCDYWDHNLINNQTFSVEIRSAHNML